MVALVQAILLVAQLAQASQIVLSSQPKTGNIKYMLPTERTFLLNVPEAYSGEPLPLVLSFHGAHGNSLRQQMVTELSDPSLKIAGKPFITAYGQGVNNTAYRDSNNNGMDHIWKGAPYENTTVDDIAYVYDIIAEVSKTYSVDSTRIYACGKSNGGGFTALLACRPDTSATFAAFAPVSPALYEGTFAFHGCNPSRPAPIFHAHGVEDRVTPFHGRTPEAARGGFGPEPDVRLWRTEWAERNGCRGRYEGAWPLPEVKEVHSGAWEEVWECEGAEVRSLSIEGLGHAWPSRKGLDKSGGVNSTANFDFTREHLVGFFSRHHL